VEESCGQPVSAPLRPAEESGQPDWLLASLGVLVAALPLAGGLAVLAEQAAGLGSGTRPDHGHAARWADAPTRQPIALPATGCWPILPAAPASRPSAGPGGAVRTHYFAPDAQR
jgi:hypothetical protein